MTLDAGRTRDYVCERFGQQVTESGILAYTHADEVGKMAQAIGSACWSIASFVAPVDRERAVRLLHAGLLHEAYERCGGTFEELNKLTDVETAMLIRDATPDVQLPLCRRVPEFHGQLREASLDAQFVVLADLVCTARECWQYLTAIGDGAVPEWDELLSVLDQQLLFMRGLLRSGPAQPYLAKGLQWSEESRRLYDAGCQRAKLARDRRSIASRVRRNQQLSRQRGGERAAKVA